MTLPRSILIVKRLCESHLSQTLLDCNKNKMLCEYVIKMLASSREINDVILSMHHLLTKKERIKKKYLDSGPGCISLLFNTARVC